MTDQSAIITTTSDRNKILISAGVVKYDLSRLTLYVNWLGWGQQGSGEAPI